MIKYAWGHCGDCGQNKRILHSLIIRQNILYVQYDITQYTFYLLNGRVIMSQKIDLFSLCDV